jgi:hypothetical protein
LRKRRSTVFVRPGKDVTLYVPTDTPPEVIDYLNRLKAEGMFSHGVMEIVTNYVLQSKPAASAVDYSDSLADADMDDGFESRYERNWSESGQYEHRARAANEAGRTEQHAGDRIPGGQKKWSLDQIFRQARQNSGKLTNDS